MSRDATKLVGLPVLSIATGVELGSVDMVLFDPGKHQLYGVVVKGQSKDDPRRIVRTENIRSFGDQAITIPDEQSAAAFDSDDKARELANGGGLLGGMRLITVEGNEVGKVDNVDLNDDGSIASYHSSSGFLGLGSGKQITPGEVVSAGADVIIVSAAVS